MGWKDWSYWLTGGIMGGVLGIITLLIGLMIIPSDLSGFSSPLFVILLPSLLIANFIIESIGGSYPSQTLQNIVIPITMIIQFVIWGIIGALIGWIYGKFKKKPETTSSQ